MKSIIAATACLLCIFSHAQQSYLLVGTYDSPKSEGIYVYRFDSKDGSAKEISHIKTSNPSFLCVSPDEKYLYAVNETGDSTGKGGKVSAFSFDKKNGTLQFLNQQSSEGNHPCYVAIDRSGNQLFVVNYSSGHFAAYDLNNGLIEPASFTKHHQGNGPDTVRQRSPHLHGIFRDNKFLYITDLGADRITVYPLYPKIVFDKERSFLTQSGGGPRHMAFHSPYKYFYVINELSSSIEVFEQHKFRSIQTISALPLSYKGPVAGSADIHISPDGKFLYVSNRGMSNTIGIYSIDPQTGMLKIVDHVYSGGEGPRNFNFDPSGNFLLVANQKTDEIVLFKRNILTGTLTDTGKRIAIGKPVCIKWISIVY